MSAASIFRTPFDMDLQTALIHSLNPEISVEEAKKRAQSMADEEYAKKLAAGEQAAQAQQYYGGIETFGHDDFQIVSITNTTQVTVGSSAAAATQAALLRLTRASPPPLIKPLPSQAPQRALTNSPANEHETDALNELMQQLKVSINEVQAPHTSHTSAATSSSSSSSSRAPAVLSHNPVHIAQLTVDELCRTYLTEYRKAFDGEKIIKLLQMIACKILATDRKWLKNAPTTKQEALTELGVAFSKLSVELRTRVTIVLANFYQPANKQFTDMSPADLFASFSEIKSPLTGKPFIEATNTQDRLVLLLEVNTMIRLLISELHLHKNDALRPVTVHKRDSSQQLPVLAAVVPNSKTASQKDAVVARVATSSMPNQTAVLEVTKPNFLSPTARELRLLMNGTPQAICTQYFDAMFRDKSFHRNVYLKFLLRTLACRIEGRINQLIPSNDEGFEQLFHETRTAFNNTLASYPLNNITASLLTLRNLMRRKSELNLSSEEYQTIYEKDLPSSASKQIIATQTNNTNKTLLLLIQGLGMFHFQDTQQMAISPAITTQNIFKWFLNQFSLIENNELQTYHAHLLITTLARKTMLQELKNANKVPTAPPVQELTDKAVTKPFTQVVQQLMTVMQEIARDGNFLQATLLIKEHLQIAAESLMKGEESFILNCKASRQGPFRAQEPNYSKLYTLWNIREFATILNAAWNTREILLK